MAKTKTVFTPQPLIAFRDKRSVSIYRRLSDGTCGPEVAEIVLETIEADDDEEALEYAFAEATHMAAATDLLEMLTAAAARFDELALLVTSGMFDAAEDWVRANADRVDIEIAAAIAKAKA